MLHLLPVEIVEQILFYVDVPDLDNLLSIPAFKDALSDKIGLIICEESLKQLYPHIGQRYQITDHANGMERCLCVVVLGELSSESLRDELVKNHIPKKFCFPNMDRSETITESTLSFLQNERRCIKDTAFFQYATEDYQSSCTLKFEDYWNPLIHRCSQLRSLILQDVGFFPEALDLPCLEKLNLIGCSSLDTSTRWDLPKLTTLVVEETFDSINSSIDYETIMITTLRLHLIRDDIHWFGFNNDSINSLSVTLEGSASLKIEDTSFLSLKRAFLSSGGALTLHRVSLSSLTNVEIKLSECISISGLDAPSCRALSVSSSASSKRDHFCFIDAPKLSNMRLSGCHFSLIMGNNFPSLKEVYLCSVMGPNDERCYDFLQGVAGLKMMSSDPWWKYTPNIEYLNISDNKSSNLEDLREFQLPKLKDYCITYIRDASFSPLELTCGSPLPNSPRLETISIMNFATHPSDIRDIQRKYSSSLLIISVIEQPLLKTDYITGYTFHLEEVSFPVLESLSMEMGYPVTYNFMNANFPKLNYLLLTSSLPGANNGHPVLDEFHLDLKAPELCLLSLEDTSVGPNPCIQELPKLKSLRILNPPDLNVQSLTVVRCPQLEAFLLEKETPNQDGSILLIRHDGSLDKVVDLNTNYKYKRLETMV